MKTPSKKQHELLQQIREADCTAFFVLYESYLNRFLESIKRCHYHCTTDEAKDAFDEAVFIFFDQLRDNPDFRLESNIFTYLYSVAVHKLLQNIRKNILCLGTDEEYDLTNVPDNNTGDDYNAETLRLINDFKQNLSQTEKMILHYRYVQNLTWNEIAILMSAKSVFALKKKHAIIIREMREMLRRVGRMR